MSARRIPLAEEVLRIVQHDLAQPHHTWQVAVVVFALLGAWLFARHVHRRIDARVEAEAKRPVRRIDLRQFSIEGFRRLAFPVAGILLLIAGGLTLRAVDLVRRAGDVHLLRLALTLLGAMALVRVFVYVLRRAFPRSRWIGAFERGIALTIWLLVALHVTGLLTDLIGLLETVRIPLGKSQLTLLDVVVAVVSVVLTLVGAMWLGSVLEAHLMKATTLTANVRVVLSRVTRALLAFLAVLIALSVVGIDLTVLSIFGGALGVGLGLGLQRVASNYVSGFIILLDRSLAIGDMITVDKFSGAVTQINTRYTVVRALDGTETNVPNEMLMSSPVVNHTRTDRKARVAVKVAVAYDSDLERVIAVLLDATRGASRVLSDPSPSAVVTALAHDGVELELGVWVRVPDDAAVVRSDVSRRILQALTDAGIEISSPQGSIQIRSVHDAGRKGLPAA